MATRTTFTDAELIQAIRSKTNVNQALLFLYDRYYRLLERYVLTNSGSEMDAEDVVQEVMVSLVDLIQQDKYRGEASVKSLLFTLARNHWITMLRKRGSDTRRNEVFETERDQEEDDVSAYVMSLEAQQTLTALFDRLGDACRKILTLFYYQNLSMKEILTQTDYGSEQVLRNKKHKCLKDMTEFVQRTPGLSESVRDALQRTR
ncbi:RNA polymerase sigma factor [Spirosoma montaniterrae]|uniref:RNA polymerase subunit sigma-24 n=1 Tax=Spirosoma montaniterrae TaxID=1178516 RepID=A0A1P9WTH1_9BACT|nr:sigma-70 family RNA polymerase sigma factor [Spirosoma montaniterrae]AQG78640.1 RNA polymerase subunit sigma-24 [Spirosoma montaniterrae]